MYILCYFVVLILCDISFVNCFGDIHIKVTDQHDSYEMHDQNVTLNYDKGDVARLKCIISTKAFEDGKSTLSWMDDYGHVYLTKAVQILELNITLTDAEDGLILHCKAITKQATLSLYVNFIRNKTETEMAMKRPSLFWILILSICGFVGGSLLLLIIWSFVSRLCKKKVKECDTQVIFSEDLDYTQNNLNLESSNTEFTEIGIRNQIEDLQNGVKENDIDRREDIDSDRREENFRQNSIYVTVEESRRHGSSTEC